MRFNAKSALLLFVLVALCTAPVSAQCFMPDGFDAPGCCVNVMPTLPQFQQGILTAQFACLFNCDVEETADCEIAIGNQIMLPSFCDTPFAPIQIFSGDFNVSNTFMIMKYSGSWEEINANGQNIQVWRFLVNIEMVLNPSSTTVPTPCPIPPCQANAGKRIFFVGHLDYIRPCIAGVTVPPRPAAISLTHYCGRFSHQPWSACPLMAPDSHPERTYAFVGPTPFQWGGATVPQVTPNNQTISSDRSTDISITPLLSQDCFNRNPASNVVMQTVNQTCFCADPTVPAQPLWHELDFRFQYRCGMMAPNQFMPVGFPTYLPTGMAAFNLGKYIGPEYPGDESLSTMIGVAFAPDICLNALPWHHVLGVTTEGGDPMIVTDSSGVTITSFERVDLCNSLLIDCNAFPNCLNVGLGGLFFSTRSWVMNF